MCNLLVDGPPSIQGQYVDNCALRDKRGTVEKDLHKLALKEPYSHSAV